MNIKARFTNYIFLVAIGALILKVLTGEGIITELVAARYDGYFQDFLSVLILAGIVVNPATKGFKD